MHKTDLLVQQLKNPKLKESAFGQERNEEDIDFLLDEIFFSEKQFLDEMLLSGLSQDFVYTSFTRNSNTFFSGRT